MIDRQQLKTIADQIETVGGRHIAALKIMEAADEIERMRIEGHQLIRAYVNTLEVCRDRIISLGGTCDPVDRMESGDPALIRAKAAFALSATDREKSGRE